MGAGWGGRGYLRGEVEEEVLRRRAGSESKGSAEGGGRSGEDGGVIVR